MVIIMVKVFKFIFCTLFFAICIFFLAAMLIPGASNVAEGGVTAPKLFDESGINQDFGNQYEEYFSKAFAFRGKVVDIYSTIRERLFGEGNDQVVVGRDDFLFFSETIDNYLGTNPMTDDEISAAADSVTALADYAESRGAKFLFVAAPNKNHIYSEYMPSRYIMSDQPTDLDRLIQELADRGVEVADPRAALIAAKGGTDSTEAEAGGAARNSDDNLLYHRRDTHWNERGARVAAELIAEKLGFTLVDFDSLKFSDKQDLRGDLDTLLYPDSIKYDSNPTWDFSEQFIYTSAFSSTMDMQITTRGAGKGKLLIFRDSFANALIPILASSFEEARFERAIPYRIDLLDSFDADYVIVEITERNLRSLIGSDERVTG